MHWLAFLVLLLLPFSFHFPLFHDKRENETQIESRGGRMLTGFGDPFNLFCFVLFSGPLVVRSILSAQELLKERLGEIKLLNYQLISVVPGEERLNWC